MRHLVVCVTVLITVVGSFSVGRRFVTAQPSERDSRTVNVAQDNSWTFIARITKPDAAAKAAVQPRLEGELGASAKPAAQPALQLEPVVVSAAKPEKKMVGPDGVVFVRSKTPALNAMVASHLGHPIAPDSLGLAEQAKASEPAVVVQTTVAEKATSSTADAAPKPETAALAAGNKNERNPPSPATPKRSALMVGPDGVIYQPVGRTHALTPH